jgi:hypothetical protein
MARAQSLFLMWAHNNCVAFLRLAHHLLATHSRHSFHFTLFFFMALSHMSFGDMMDMPLDSSPLKSSSPTTSPTHSSDLPPVPDSPTPQGANAPQVQRKRPGEDLSQFATGVARANKLVKTDHDQLTVFSKVSLLTEDGGLLIFSLDSWGVQSSPSQ